MKEKKEKFFKSIKRRDPAARYALQILLTYPGVKAIIWYRVAHFFFSKLHLKLIGEMIAFITRKRTGIEIHPGCKIGRNLFIDHGRSHRRNSHNRRQLHHVSRCYSWSYCKQRGRWKKTPNNRLQRHVRC